VDGEPSVRKAVMRAGLVENLHSRFGVDRDLWKCRVKLHVRLGNLATLHNSLVPFFETVGGHIS